MPAAAQGRADNVDVVLTPVAGPVQMLEGAGGNIGVSAGEDGVLIVDDQFAWLSEKLLAALAELHPDKPRFVLNTHWHGDHTGGNEAFAQFATIVAHENVRERLAGGSTIPGRETPPAPQAALPVITFDASLAVHFNGEEISLTHVPHAHTDGDAVVFFHDSNVVHMGDLFFSGRFPFVDLASGGSVAGLIEAIESFAGTLHDDVKIIPGHGPLSSRADLEAYLEMPRETTRIVRERMTAGATLDEVKEAGLPKSWSSWGSGFVNEERWIETIHESYTPGM